MKTNNKLGNFYFYISILFAVVSPYIFYRLIDHEKTVYIVSFFLILLLIFLASNLDKPVTNIFSILINLLNSINIYMYYFVIFIFVFITQNLYLNYETITWDTASYLVASLSLQDGYLPYEAQWESKGPLLTYIYYFLILISNKSLVLIKLLNDLILFIISIFMFKTISIVKKEQKLYSLTATLLFLSLLSEPQYISAYSELFVLLFISIAYYLYCKFEWKNNNIFSIPLIISLASLINQVAVIFLLPYIFDILVKKKIKHQNIQNITFWIFATACFISRNIPC